MNNTLIAIVLSVGILAGCQDSVGPDVMRTETAVKVEDWLLDDGPLSIAMDTDPNATREERIAQSRRTIEAQQKVLIALIGTSDPSTAEQRVNELVAELDGDQKVVASQVGSIAVLKLALREGPGSDVSAETRSGLLLRHLQNLARHQSSHFTTIADAMDRLEEIDPDADLNDLAHSFIDGLDERAEKDMDAILKRAGVNPEDSETFHGPLPEPVQRIARRAE